MTNESSSNLNFPVENNDCPETTTIEKHCETIRDILLCAHYDLFFLKSMEEFGGAHEGALISDRAHRAISHLCELAKADLALSVYKVWIDNDKKALTNKSLNREIQKTLGSHCSGGPKLKLSNKKQGDMRANRNDSQTVPSP